MRRVSVWWSCPRAARIVTIVVVIASGWATFGGQHAVGKSTFAQAEPQLSTVHDPQWDDRSDQVSLVRAYHGAIFFARVDALVRETAEPRSADLPPSVVQHYLVTVDRVLAGDASGQVPVTYFDALVITSNNNGFSPLRIGERYLLFAGFSPETGEYLVGAGSGTILVTNLEQEERLARGYAPLILDAEAREQQLIAGIRKWNPAHAARRGVLPIATVYPTQGPPGSRPRIYGAMFGHDEVMILFGDDVTFDDVRSEDGSFKKRVIIPKDAPVGPFPIVVDDEEGFTIDLTFTVKK